MSGALRAMLEGVIDYAGLFPPAKLPMPEAVQEYHSIVQGRDRWIVDRFSCPAGKLRDLAVALSENPEGPHLAITVIGANPPDHRHWKHGLEHDAGEMLKFQKAAENHAEIQAYEVKLPDHAHAEAMLPDLKAFGNVDLFAELPWSPEMADTLAMMAEMDFVNAKARTGGATAAAIPSASELAQFLQQCVQLDLSFKLTAGLHHPLPSLDSSLNATTHGFLNVLMATTLALSEDLSLRELEAILAETDARSFVFKRESCSCRGHRATLPDIEAARTLFCSFGSCSVAEPIEGLEAAGLLDGITL